MTSLERAPRSDERVLESETQAVPEAVPQLRRAVVAFAREQRVPAPVLADVRLAVSEAVANAVMHAYEPGDDPRPIRLRAAIDGGFLTITITDDGHGIRAKTSEGQGLGLGLIANSAADLRIERHVPQGTQVRMRFVIDI